MEPLTMHFHAEPGTDLEPIAAELRAAIAGSDTVELVEARPQRFQSSIGLPEILAIIALLPAIPQGIAAVPKAIEVVQDAWKKVRLKFPGIQTPSVEVGLRTVPIDQLQAEDIIELSGAD